MKEQVKKSSRDKNKSFHFSLHLLSIPMLWTFGVTYKAEILQSNKKVKEKQVISLTCFFCYSYLSGRASQLYLFIYFFN